MNESLLKLVSVPVRFFSSCCGLAFVSCVLLLCSGVQVGWVREAPPRAVATASPPCTAVSYGFTRGAPFLFLPFVFFFFFFRSFRFPSHRRRVRRPCSSRRRPRPSTPFAARAAASRGPCAWSLPLPLMGEGARCLSSAGRRWRVGLGLTRSNPATQP